VRPIGEVTMTPKGAAQCWWTLHLRIHLSGCCSHDSFDRSCWQGAYGWRLDPNVKSYSSYEQWEAPPDPENVQVGNSSVPGMTVPMTAACPTRAGTLAVSAAFIQHSALVMQLESVNVAAGREELESLGLAPPPRHIEQRSTR
jgi:hypothetical protein